MAVKDLFRVLWSGISAALPKIGAALRRPEVRAVLATRVPPKVIEIILALIELAEKMDSATNAEKHEFVKAKAIPHALSLGVKETEIDALIHMGVGKKRGWADIVTVAG